MFSWIAVWAVGVLVEEGNVRGDMHTQNAPVERSHISGVDSRIGSADESLPLDDQLSQLMDLLVTIRLNLTTGIMPRAARITGTSDRLYGAVDHVDAAIR